MNIREYANAFYVRYYDEDLQIWETIQPDKENQNKGEEGRLFNGISPNSYEGY